MLAWRIKEIDIAQTRIGVVEVKKAHLVPLAKTNDQTLQLGDLDAPVQALGLEQKLELSVGDARVETFGFFGGLFLLGFFELFFFDVVFVLVLVYVLHGFFIVFSGLVSLHFFVVFHF